MPHLKSHTSSALVGSRTGKMIWSSTFPAPMDGCSVEVERNRGAWWVINTVYGTQGFAELLIGLGRRADMVRIIAVDAKGLVYFDAVRDRACQYPRL